MVNSTITQWLNSGEYLTEIDCVLTNIVRASELSNSEAETASVFEREIFFLLKQKLNFDIDIQKEKVVKGIVHSFNSGVSHGRVDSIMNDLIIEYKHHSALISEAEVLSAYQQVSDYLIALNNNNGEKRDAILTDGTKIAYFSFVGEEVRHTAIKVLEKSDIDTVIKAILNKSTKKFESGNIVKDFAISPISDSDSKKVSKVLLNELLHNVAEKSQMLFSEWKGLMHLSIDDNGKSLDIEKRRIDLSNIFGFTITDPDIEYKALFALQTTYAIIVKLITCKVVDRLNFNSDTSGYHDLVNLTSDKLLKFFLNLEDGYSYSSQGIRNFLEGDFFSWYADKNQWNDKIYNSISSLIKTVDTYSAFSLEVSYNPIDIFKDLYMSIIPQSVRHSMGEYFKTRKAQTWHWYDLSVGIGGVVVQFTVNTTSNYLTVGIVVFDSDHSLYDSYKDMENEIQQLLKRTDIVWKASQKSAKFSIGRTVNLKDSSTWNEDFEWLCNQALLLRKFVKSHSK